MPQVVIKELDQPHRRWRQERHKFAYLIVHINSSFARFARAFLIFIHFAGVRVKDGMSWRYGMWYDLRNGIIMRNVIYAFANIFL